RGSEARSPTASGRLARRLARLTGRPDADYDRPTSVPATIPRGTGEGMKNYVDTAELKLPKFIEHEFKEFCRGIVETFQDDVHSITVYGSVARHEYFPERSDINTLIVL